MEGVESGRSELMCFDLPPERFSTSELPWKRRDGCDFFLLLIYIKADRNSTRL